MGDFPLGQYEHLAGGVIHTNGHPFMTVGSSEFLGVGFAAAAWPTANLGLYFPFVLDLPKTAKQMFWENGGVAGTTDVGIYDSLGNRLVSLGPTTNAGSIQVGNITDTDLLPGLYYAGMVASTVTTQTYWSVPVGVAALRACGAQQQAIGSATLPNPATFAVVANAYMPMIGIAFQGTM